MLGIQSIIEIRLSRSKKSINKPPFISISDKQEIPRFTWHQLMSVTQVPIWNESTLNESSPYKPFHNPRHMSIDSNLRKSSTTVRRYLAVQVLDCVYDDLISCWLGSSVNTPRQHFQHWRGLWLDAEQDYTYNRLILERWKWQWECICTIMAPSPIALNLWNVHILIYL